MRSALPNVRVRAHRIAWGAAIALHAAAAVLMLGARDRWPPSNPEPIEPGEYRVAMELAAPAEADAGLMMPTGLPSPARRPDPASLVSFPPPIQPQRAKAMPTPQSAAAVPTPFALDAQSRAELERDQANARAELERLHQEGQAAADRTLAQARNEMRQSPPAAEPDASDTAPRPNSSARSDKPAPVPVGTVRELDLSGYPQGATDRVMQRYGLRITERAVAAGVPQTFLSSASSPDGGRFLSDRAGASNAPGIYHVFLLSAKSVAVMSQLEDAELAKRNLDPLRTRVTHVKFGLVGPENDPDLGVILFEAEPVQP